MGIPRRRRGILSSAAASLLGSLLLAALLLTACKSKPAPDLSGQKLLQVAVLLGYDQPAAYRNVAAGLARASAELSQVRATIFGQPSAPPRPSTAKRTGRRRPKNPPPNSPGNSPGNSPENATEPGNPKRQFQDSFRKQSQWKNQQIRQIVAQGYDALILFGDELVDLEEGLLAAQQAGLLIVSCGFSSKPLIAAGQHSVYSPAPRRRRGILSSAAAQPAAPAYEEAEAQPAVLQAKTETGNVQGLVNVNIAPSSVMALASRLGEFLQTKTAHSVLLLFGPHDLPFTKTLYRQLSGAISRYRAAIQGVRFLDPLRLRSGEQLRQLVLGLPQNGLILALEPLLLQSSAQLLQRYGSGLRLVGLGWPDLVDPLLASNIRQLLPLRYDSLAYAAVYASFALYSGQKRGLRGEYFLLGSYGQRQVGPDGSLVLSLSEALVQPASPAEGAKPQGLRHPSRLPQAPRRSSVLSENDLPK